MTPETARLRAEAFHDWLRTVQCPPDIRTLVEAEVRRLLAVAYDKHPAPVVELHVAALSQAVAQLADAQHVIEQLAAGRMVLLDAIARAGAVAAHPAGDLARVEMPASAWDAVLAAKEAPVQP